MSWFIAQLCWGENWGKGWCWRVTASKSHEQRPPSPAQHVLASHSVWPLILSGLSSLSFNGPAKPLAGEEATLLPVLAPCTSWNLCKMIFVLSGVNTRPCCCWAVGPGGQLPWPCLWRCCGEVYSAAQGQGLCCCFRGCIPGLGKPRPTGNMFVCMYVHAVLYPSVSLRILLHKPLVFLLFILCLTSPHSCQHPWMSVYPLFQRQGFTPLHPALLPWCESISVCRAAAAAGDELWECSGGTQELLWCPSGSPCSPDIQKPVLCQLGWLCRTAMPGVRRLLHHVPSPKESWSMAPV